MVNLLITVVLIGAAVTYALESINALLMGFLDKSLVNKLLSLPLNVGGMWVMTQRWILQMLVTVPAATFVSLILLKYLNKTTQVQYQRLPRL